MATLSEHCNFILLRMSQGVSLDEAAQELRKRGVSHDDIVAVRIALPSSSITGLCQQCGATIPQPGEDQCQQCYADEQDGRLRPELAENSIAGQDTAESPRWRLVTALVCVLAFLATVRGYFRSSDERQRDAQRQSEWDRMTNEDRERNALFDDAGKQPDHPR